MKIRVLFRKYEVELWFAFLIVFGVAITWITYVKSGRVEAKFNLLFYAIGGLIGAARSTNKFVLNARHKTDDLAVRVQLLEDFVTALAASKTVEPIAKKTEEKMPS